MKKQYKYFLIVFVVAALFVLGFLYVKHVDFSLEEFVIRIWNQYVQDWGYIILFFWSVLEGELGLIFAGIASHTGHLNVWVSIFVAGLGGFVGDQIYFYIGRFNKGYIQKKLASQRRKIALAHLLLQKYGWPIIFVQRYMYGMRTVIPISIGLTRYSATKFAIINLISAWVWAAITILLAWVLGEQILEMLGFFKQYPYVFVIIGATFVVMILWYFSANTKKIDKKIEKIQTQLAKEKNEK